MDIRLNNYEVLSPCKENLKVEKHKLKVLNL